MLLSYVEVVYSRTAFTGKTIGTPPLRLKISKTFTIRPMIERYKNFGGCVRINGAYSDLLNIKGGVRKRCVPT